MWTWWRRFLERGRDGLGDEPRPGVPGKITDADVERVIVKTLEETTKNGTHWSTRSMAAATGMSQSTVSSVRAGSAPVADAQAVDGSAANRQSSRRSWSLPRCAGEGSGPLHGCKVADPGPGPVPADPADVPGAPERRSHDYIRAGTTTLFAAREVTTG
ncbi:helix-turn-helix domain-containing protein [Streptomyces sp. NPDC058701]|uniref:helix-turn-helix domain-containing protein n=1 Tax=Streptomyces sp. NPDC058701 TaxID=3346608 RepID=UPI00365AEEC1